jgi:zinc D-Ala-D-Ala dipeptidase
VKLAVLIAALGAISACGRSESTPSPISEPSPPAVPRDAARVVEAVPTDAIDTTRVPDGAQQIITAIVDDWTATRATLRSWRRELGQWRSDGPAWQGVVGRAGTGWGSGLHGIGAPPGRPGPVKREGDGKSPAGMFALRGSYGYAAAAPPGTRTPYVALDENWNCVDDPASAHYNQIVDRRTVDAVDWKSDETMRRKDELYTWVVDVAHNPARTANLGSCIFFHVWRGLDSVTVGCTAMAEDRLAKLIATLDPGAVYVLLPRAEYAALAERWGLPR